VPSGRDTQKSEKQNFRFLLKWPPIKQNEKNAAQKITIYSIGYRLK
jgi:hypothetical protein